MVSNLELYYRKNPQTALCRCGTRIFNYREIYSLKPKLYSEFTPIENLPPPPAWMVGEAKIEENVEKMVKEDNKKLMDYVQLHAGDKCTFQEFKKDRIYNYIEYRPEKHIEQIKIKKVTKCFVTIEWPRQKHTEKRKIQKHESGREYIDIGHKYLSVNELYDPKDDETSAAKIIQRGFRFHRWNIKGKFIWKVEERHMNDDGFFWDKEGNMMKK